MGRQRRETRERERRKVKKRQVNKERRIEKLEKNENYVFGIFQNGRGKQG